MGKNELGFLGLLYRGHQAFIGKEAKAALAGISLLVVASDASPRIAGEYVLRAEKRGVPVLRDVSKADLGRALGRKEVSCLAILGKKAAESLLAKRKEND
ncbi:MAG: ribosomal L7Ae/L30e/S12e/Gadd45 family protein [Bacilli bacterium]|jgi:ribosomal protein L7Ae-like RNA K-turn-binding protein|nr:ribosomal L7Ae/L30e/S12e/Gadd45 family protein [Bacilli bacterium]